MQSKENANDSIEEAYRLRRNVILSILIFCVAITGIYAYNQYSKANDLQQKVDKRLAYNKKVDKKNKKIEDENIKLKKSIGVYDTERSSKKFYDKFFVWNTWEQYLDNMKQLQLLYPQINDGKVVNIKGDKRGAGASPDSSYTKETFISKDKGETADIVTQTKQYFDGSESVAIWYVISKYENGKYDISHMKAYREAH
ncbi:hypothetical protein L6D11_13965 [Staphylococcus aureus]|nr:hypothetical protein [Staphylococcus aureus]